MHIVKILAYFAVFTSENFQQTQRIFMCHQLLGILKLDTDRDLVKKLLTVGFLFVRVYTFVFVQIWSQYLFPTSSDNVWKTSLVRFAVAIQTSWKAELTFDVNKVVHKFHFGRIQNWGAFYFRSFFNENFKVYLHVGFEKRRANFVENGVTFAYFFNTSMYGCHCRLDLENAILKRFKIIV